MTTNQAKVQLRGFGRWRTDRVREIASGGSPDAVSPELLLAIASKETNLSNIVGGGYFDETQITPSNTRGWVATGVDRGLWQMNADVHHLWLDSIPGCASGSYDEVYDSALPKGRVPGLSRGCKKALGILRWNHAYALTQGIPENDAIKVAVAGYNCGVATARQAYVKYGDADKWTTGGTYSKDVLERRTAFRRAINDLGWR